MLYLKIPKQITSNADRQNNEVVGSILESKSPSISPNPFQPRLDFDKEPLTELVTL